MTPLTAREIADQLSLHEYRHLCLFFDLRAAQGKVQAMMSRHGDGSDVQFIKPLCPRAKFDVFAVDRTPVTLYITCRGEDGQMLRVDATPYQSHKVFDIGIERNKRTGAA